MLPPFVSSRRDFLRQTAPGLVLLPYLPWSGSVTGNPVELPAGGAPAALEAAWFPGPLHAFVWRNWSLVPLERMAAVVGARNEDLARLGHGMGLAPTQGLGDARWRRAHLTILRRRRNGRGRSPESCASASRMVPSKERIRCSRSSTP